MTFIIIASIAVLLAIGVTLFMHLSPQFGAGSKALKSEQITGSQNYMDGAFQNVEPTKVMLKVDYSTIPGYFTNGDKVPDWKIPVQKLPADYFANAPDTLTRVTWFGHSALMLEMDGKKIFLDPMLGNVPSPIPALGSPRFVEELPMSIDDLSALDAIIISHDHYDHLDYGSIQQLHERTKHFFVPLGVKAHLESWGVPSDKISEFDWWQETTFEGIELACTPARHFSGRGMFDRGSTLWCSWVIKGQNASIFFGGDSGYDDTFKKIGEMYGPFDLTMLECGQYDKQWAQIHMMPEEVAQANIDLRGKVLLPIHWGAFKLGLHSWTDPIERLTAKATELDVKLATPVIGEPVVIGQQVPQSEWWMKE